MTETKEKRVTRREYFNQLLAIPEVANNEGLANFITHQIELIDNKNATAKSKPNAAQQANNELKKLLLELLAVEGEPITITELQKRHPEEIGRELYSNQKLSALLHTMDTSEKGTGQVIFSKVGRNTFVALA